MECKEQDLSTLANLDGKKIKFVQRIRTIVEDHSKYLMPAFPAFPFRDCIAL